MDENNLEKRIELLEKRISFLENHVRPKKENVNFLSHPVSSTPKQNITQPIQEERNSSFWQQSDFWLNKVGVTLFLISIAYFFSYSIEQGWLNETLRLLVGILTGFALIGLSYFVRDDRVSMPDLLKGAGFGIFYLSLYAAFNWYAILSVEMAAILTVLITALAFSLAWFHNREYIGIFAVVGGYISPLLLSSGSDNFVGLTLFITIIALVSAWTSVQKNWRKMGALTIFVGWTLLILGQYYIFNEYNSSQFEKSLSSFLLLVFIIATGPIKLIKKETTKDWMEWNYLFVISPLIFVLLIKNLFNLSDSICGLFGGSITAILYVLFFYTKDHIQRVTLLSSTAVLGSLSFILFFDTDISIVFPAIFGAISLLIISKKSDLFILIDWVLMTIGLLGTGYYFQQSYASITPFLSFEAFLIFAMLVSVGFAISEFKDAIYAIIIGLFAHIIFLRWISIEFYSLRLALLFTVSIWVIYTVFLLIIAVRNDLEKVKNLALGTLAFIILKLFLFDLQNLEFFWRFILLAGVGGFLMVISYAYKKLVKEVE